MKYEVRRLSGELKSFFGRARKKKKAPLCKAVRRIRKLSQTHSTAEKQAVYIDAYADLPKEILPVYDTLERALTMAGDTTDPVKLIEGIPFTLDMFYRSACQNGNRTLWRAGRKI